MNKEHRFGSDGRCKGCCIRLDYLQDALAMLSQWPESEEKEKRINEMKECNS